MAKKIKDVPLELVFKIAGYECSLGIIKAITLLQRNYYNIKKRELMTEFGFLGNTKVGVGPGTTRSYLSDLNISYAGFRHDGSPIVELYAKIHNHWGKQPDGTMIFSSDTRFSSF